MQLQWMKCFCNLPARQVVLTDVEIIMLRAIEYELSFVASHTAAFSSLFSKSEPQSHNETQNLMPWCLRGSKKDAERLVW